MLKPPSRLQPSYYEAFRCVGSDCEDTCCSGWRVPVDKATFEKYQTCAHSTLGPKLKSLVTIAPSPESDDSWAEMKLTQGVCNFLAGGLCEIHSTLGHELLSKNCATYPRVMTTVDGVIERSLDLSCPEAARLALTNPDPIRFIAVAGQDDDARLGTLGTPDTMDSYVLEVQSLVISVLQNRDHSLSQRLVALGRLCDKLESVEKENGYESLQDLCRQPIFFDSPQAMPSMARFEAVVELILARIGSDATSRRFLNCYQSFMAGLHWTMESTMEQLEESLDAAFAGPFAAFRAKHAYVLEHYLVASVFRSLFPFGSTSVNRKLAEHGFVHSITRQYQRLVVDFVIVETLLAGLAAFYGERFGLPEALMLIQSTTKTFEHSISYPAKAIDLLRQKGLIDCASMSKLIRD